MNHLRRLRFVLGVVFALATIPVTALSEQDSEVRDEAHIVIVPISDTQRIFELNGRGGYARISAVVEEERGDSDAVVVVHAGNLYSPSLFSALDGGVHAVDMLNRLGVTVMSPGHHEYNFGASIASRRFAEARFPVVLSNARTVDGGIPAGTTRFEIVEVAGYRLGFMGLLPRETSRISSPGSLIIDDPVATAATVAAELRAAGAEVVIALADLRREDIGRIREAGGVDLIFTAQGPTPNAPFWLEADATSIALHPAEAGDRIAVADLHLHRTIREVVKPSDLDPSVQTTPEEFDPDRFFEVATQETVTRWRADIRLRDTARLEPDRFADIVIAQHYAVFRHRIDEPLATVAAPFDTARAPLRRSENAFANYVTDAMRSAAGADIAFINAGAIRDDRDFDPGDVYTFRDLLTALPFRNRIVTVTLTGRRLAALLESGLDAASIGSPRFLHVSGVTIRYSPTGRPGARICSIRFGDIPLNHGARYRIATNEFLARGGDGYDVLQRNSTEAEDRGDLIDMLRQRLVADGRLAPVEDGRLQAGC